MVGKKWLLALLIIAMVLSPTLSLAQIGSGGSGSNPLATFLTDLEILIPTILFIMSLLALRGGDYEYAFTLLLASVIAVGGIAYVTGGNAPGSVPISLVKLNVQVSGVSSAYIGNTETYTAYWTPTMDANVTWIVTLNGTEVYNITQEYVQPGGAKLTYTFDNQGVYTVEAVVVNEGQYATGSGAVVVQVTPQPSPLGWIEGAITSAFNLLMSYYLQGVGEFLSALQLLGTPLELMFYSPTPQMFNATYIFSPTAIGLQGLYNDMMSYSIGIAMLFISFSITYNALRGYYEDLIDIASDLFYKLGVWMLFTFGGFEIYSFIAQFINNMIWSVTGSALGMVAIDLGSGLALLIALFIGGASIPFFGGDIKVLLGNLMTFMLISTGLAVIRYAIMLAIVVSIPLWASLWLFEWSRGIAMRVIDILVGLMIGGLISALTLAVLVILPFGSFLLIIAPAVFDIEFMLSFFLFMFSLSPSELARGLKTRKPQAGKTDNQGTAPQTAPAQAPAQSPAPQQTQKSQSLAYI